LNQISVNHDLVLDREAILKLLPHRTPMLFADRATANQELNSIITEHLFKSDEPYFEGHFPGDPIVPGVVLIECLAQAGRLLLNLRAGSIRKGYLVGVESAKFNQIIRPGDEPRFEVRILENSGIESGRGLIYSAKGAAYIGRTRCARAHFNLYQTT
jgi:3-hydroxyacyl-[acyl-carrier-protein] dehydratase